MTTKSDNDILKGIHNPDISHVLHPLTIRHLAREWLKEDAPNFDYGGFVVGEKEETAVLLLKSEGVLAGKPFFDAIFKELDCTVTWNIPEGTFLTPVNAVATVSGKVRQILLGERVALNIITRASGIASAAKRIRTTVEDLGWHGEVAGTRKTTPGFRMVEKYSLLVGGVSTHRYDLSSMIMLKDNHIWTAGSITQIEVECRSLEDAREAASAGSDVIMLDNFTPQALVDAAAKLKKEYPKLIIEASGGITEETIARYCDVNVDVISLSRLTQGYDVVDFSLKIRKDGIDPRNTPVNL
ncbi:NADC-like protein [Mya arenaria]|uniref:Nicotinate-nucleotide pyrophosphorylase [carboxylating] n=1 Tax=Mya arenaria TaxID=6604 RepID=A0ABY7DUM2_MYAAR|nr:NADC-like protein [Mya arenaria]